MISSPAQTGSPHSNSWPPWTIVGEVDPDVGVEDRRAHRRGAVDDAEHRRRDQVAEAGRLRGLGGRGGRRLSSPTASAYSRICLPADLVGRRGPTPCRRRRSSTGHRRGDSSLADGAWPPRLTEHRSDERRTMRLRPGAIPLIIAAICVPVVGAMALGVRTTRASAWAGRRRWRSQRCWSFAARAKPWTARRGRGARGRRAPGAGRSRPPRPRRRRRSGSPSSPGTPRTSGCWCRPSRRLDRWLSAEDHARAEARAPARPLGRRAGRRGAAGQRLARGQRPGAGARGRAARLSRRTRSSCSPRRRTALTRSRRSRARLELPLTRVSVRLTLSRSLGRARPPRRGRGCRERKSHLPVADSLRTQPRYVLDLDPAAARPCRSCGPSRPRGARRPARSPRSPARSSAQASSQAVIQLQEAVAALVGTGVRRARAGRRPRCPR